MKISGIVIKFFMSVIIVMAAGKLFSADQPEAEKKISFSWEALDWAVRYKIEIRDIHDKTVFQEEVEISTVEFKLPPGKYKIRIGVINKFEKFVGWSDWAATEILEKKSVTGYLFNLGISLYAGMPYYQYLTPWKSPFNDSFVGYTAKIGFNFGNFIFFRPSDTLKYTGILSYFGMEIEGGQTLFAGKKFSSKINMDKNEVLFGGNFFARTNFNFPINFIYRMGGGLAMSDFTYHTKDLVGRNITLTTNDPYYKTGLSAEYNFLRFFLVEAGAEYMVIQYISKPLKSLRYFLMAGVRI